MTAIRARRLAAAFAGMLVASPVSSAAQQAEPGRSITGQAGASINNPGVQTTLEVSWLRPLSSSTHPLLSGAHVAAGAIHTLTPAQTRVGGWVQYAPLSIVEIRAGVDPSVYFGTFNSLQGFDGYDEAFDSDARKGRAGAEPGFGLRTYVAPTLKMRAGPFVASAGAELEWWRASAEREFFYEPTRDTLLKSGGDRIIRTTAVVMYRRALDSGSLAIGPIHTTSRVPDARHNDVRKAGVLAVREYDGRRFGLPRPKLTLMAGRYLADPSKDGQWTAAVAIGFTAKRR
ncbi:MAG TPA: hypothetical protein VMN81_14010 [Vicinamibacterales bacterium]|nr:hypothetical protein [Vicinamibacterales bacterium]